MARHAKKAVTAAAEASRRTGRTFIEKLQTRNVILGALVVNLVLCLAFFDPKPHTGGDNASYIILAESILHPAHGYTDTIGPGPYQPHTQYPFGYPLILAPFVALFGRSFVALKFVSIALSLGTVLMFTLLAGRITDKRTWVCLSLAVAANPVIVDYSHWVLSEGAFLFFSMLSLYLLLRSETESPDKFGRLFWLAVLSLAFTAHIRTIGLAFAAGGGMYFLVHRKWRRLIVFSLAVGLLLAPWMVRNRVASRGHSSYGSQLLMKNPYTPELGTIGPEGMLARVWTNVKIYGEGETARVLLGSDSAWAASRAARLLAVAATLLILTGLAGRIVQGFGILESYLLVFLGIVLVWPEAWSDVRFIMPVIPIMLYYLVEGVGLIVRPLLQSKDSRSKVTAGAAIVVLFLSGAAQLARVPDNFQMLARYAAGDRYSGYYPNWRTFFQAADWVKANTPPTAVVTVRKPSLFYLWTGHKVDGYLFTTNTDSVLAGVLKTDYVIIDQVSGTTGRYLVPAVQKAPDKFKLVFQTGQPYTWVLEVLK